MFFLFIGLSTDTRELVPMIVPAILLAIVGMGTKLLTGYYAARRAGIAEPGRWRAGFALMPRGEFSIVIAGLAVAAGVDRSLAALATAYVLITMVVGPLLARIPDAERFKAATRRIQANRRAREATACSRDRRCGESAPPLLLEDRVDAGVRPVALEPHVLAELRLVPHPEA